MSPGNPDAWAVAPDSPLRALEDNIDALSIVIGPVLFLLAAIYWRFTWSQERRAGKEARLVREGGLLRRRACAGQILCRR